MPATLFAHQARVLPLKLWWPARFFGIALCIGTTAPDQEFIGRMHDNWLVNHTVGAHFWFAIPLTALLAWVTTVLLVPALLPYVPDQANARAKLQGDGTAARRLAAVALCHRRRDDASTAAPNSSSTNDMARARH